MSKRKKIFLVIFALFIIGLNIALPSWMQSLKAEEVTYLKDDVIDRLTFDSQNRLWVIVGNSLRVYEDGIITHVYTGIKPGNHPPYYGIYDDFIVNSSGHVWINWGNYVVVGDGEDWSEVPLVQEYPAITTIAVDTQGKLWAGTLNDGLFIAGKKESKHYSQEEFDHVQSIAFDNQNRTWVVSRKDKVVTGYQDFITNEVNYFDGKTWHAYTLENSPLVSKFVTFITFDKQNQMWVGTDKEIAVFDGKNWISHHTNMANLVDKIKHWRIDSMVFDGQRRVWVNDIRMFDGKTWKYYLDPYHLGVNDTAVDKDGNVWVATDNGVVVIRSGSSQPVSYAIALIAIFIASDILIYVTLLLLIIWVSIAYNAWKSIGYGLFSLPVYFIWIFMTVPNIYGSIVFGNDYRGFLNPLVLNPAMFGAVGGIIGGATEIYFERSGVSATKRWGLIGFVTGTVVSFCVMIFIFFFSYS